MLRLLALVVLLSLSVLPVRAQQPGGTRQGARVLSQSEQAIVTRRLAGVYRLQADALEAHAGEDLARFEILLDSAMADLGTLLQEGMLAGDERFYELIRSVVSEYEAYYGVPASPAVEYGSVFTVRREWTEAVASVEQPLLEETDLPNLTPQVGGVPLQVNRAVERSVVYLLNRPRHLQTLKKRAQTYFPMVEQVLAQKTYPTS